MTRFQRLKWLCLLPAAALLLRADAAHACAACFGKSDSPLAQAMNWGIFSLMAVIVSVLVCIAGFFVFIARRSAALAASVASPAPSVPPGELTVSTQKS